MQSSSSSYVYRRDLHSLPTRRSSDLSFTGGQLTTPKNHERRDVDLTTDVVDLLGTWWGEIGHPTSGEILAFPGEGRSEEHTSELQSRRDLVCRLLLEKQNQRRSITSL